MTTETKSRGAFSICQIDLQQSPAQEARQLESRSLSNFSQKAGGADRPAGSSQAAVGNIALLAQEQGSAWEEGDAGSDDLVFKTLCWGFDTEQEAIGQLVRIANEHHVPMEELAVVKTTFAQELNWSKR